MSSYPYPPTKPGDDQHDHPKPCADCDVSGFDDVNCEVEGITAESEYLKQYKEKLAGRRKAFDTARTAYDKARHDVATDLAAITHQLKRLREQLECQVDEEKRRCLTDAWHEVREQLERCGGEQGCCVTDEQCDFGYELGEHPKAPQIRALIEDFDRRVVAAEWCFDEVLVKEPDELVKRVADLKAFVEAIAAEVADQKTTDYSHAFAELLWAEYRRHKVWLGFDEHSEYADCLCLALNCSLNGRRALAKLTGVVATLDCKDKGIRDRCDWLKGHVVDEILAACRRICPPRHDEGSPAQASAG